MTSTEKNYGVDLLRVFSMVCICAHHILYHGNNINSFEMEYINKVVYIGGLYVFPVISGYVLCNKKFSFERIIKVWFQAVFYTVSLTIIFFIFSKGTIWEGGKVAITPLQNYTYWYLNEYIKLLLIMPFLNLITSKFKRNNCFILVIIIVIIPLFFNVGMYGTFSGLSLLYLIGSILRKLDIKINKIISIFLVVVYMVIILILLKGFVADKYVFSFEMLCAAIIFIIFSNFEANLLKDLISSCRKYVFGVYLIHDHPLMRYFLMKVLLFEILKYNIFINLIILVMVAVIITVLCMVVDWFRQFLFAKFKINRLIEYIGFSYE